MSVFQTATEKARAALALDGILDSARFAADIFAAIEAAGSLGKGSLAGQAIEARSRLLAAVDLIESTDTRIIEARLRVRVLKALGLDETAWRPGSMHAHKAACFVEIDAETIPDALLIAERYGPAQACNTERYKGSFYPLDKLTEKDGPAFELMPYWGELSEFGGKQVFQLRFYVETADSDIVQVRVNVADFSPIRARRHDERDGYGRLIRTTWHCEGYQTYFKSLRRMWASEGTMNDFHMY